ncbi:HpcH/HpaI aldolase/citrate lyase family protein [Pseudonocardia sp. H11422]|uniref:HpcH/HpaI aldolase/citrate lyase family protein n=1 Tax=Pseudonocardia sp. H11422 TaxID=2835866 RepID=UPI001BDC03B4|nr:CoA ester lyase [Pseudonocardia sp. H11422]
MSTTQSRSIDGMSTIGRSPATTIGPAPATYLFVPGHRPELIAKARRSAADAVVIDLEDAVPPGQRPAARETTAQALREHAGHPPVTGQQLWVRVNAAGGAEAEADLEAVGELLTHARLPKVADAAAIDWLADRAPRLVATLPAIEAAAGLLEAPSIAAHPLVVRLGLGGVDLAADLGCEDTPEALAYPRSVLVVASRAFGLPGPVNSVYTRLDDTKGLIRHAETARALGFAAQSVLSPRQLEPVRTVFGGSEREARWAREVLAAFATSAGAATRTAGGDFVDLPVAQHARRILGIAD